MINSTIKDNKKPKKNNHKETTIFKCRKGEFYPEYFVYFKDDADQIKYNNFIKFYGGTKEEKVAVKVVPSSEKPAPKLLLE